MNRDIDVDTLIVNQENYRFDPVDKPSEAIDLMLEEKGEEIFNLAKHVYEHGLDKAKYSRVLEIKKGLYLVLDGNRRVTAIKCLHDPALVKDATLRARFVNLLKTAGQVPQKVNCYVYGSEEEAAEWIKLDHTGKNGGIGQDAWEPAGKDRFDYKFSGKTSPAMQAVNLLAQETKQDIDTKALKISTVSRILSNPESRSYLGIDVKGGQIVLTAEKKEALARLDKLFNKIIIDDVAVKEVYHTIDSAKFMRDLFGDKPKKLSTVIPISPKGKTRPARKPQSLPRSAARTTLIPSSCIMRIPETKINNIYHELRGVPLADATNAIGVLFRVFLETSLDCYANKKGFAFGPNVKLAGKITKVTDWLQKKNIATAAQITNIRRVATNGNTVLAIEHFHEYVHSFTAQPAPVDLIYKWDNLQEFFEVLWKDFAVKPSKKKKR